MAFIPVEEAGSSSYMIQPTPSSSITENDVTTAVNAATSLSSDIPSLFGIQRWSNVKTFRVVLDGASGGIGHYGVGEWQWTLNNPTAADEASWGWWQNDIFKLLGRSSAVENYGYDVSFKFGYDPSTSEPITLGGYQIDTDTGYLCIKFANYVVDTTNAKIFVDITFTRNDIEYV